MLVNDVEIGEIIAISRSHRDVADLPISNATPWPLRDLWPWWPLKASGKAVRKVERRR